MKLKTSKKKKNKINIFITGHRGLIGSATKTIFEKDKKYRIITKSKTELNLLNFNNVFKFFKKSKIDYLIICSAKAGGILANSQKPFDFIYENTIMQFNLLNLARLFKVKKTVILGSSCIYPKKTHIPINENQILTGKLETTNEFYAISKISGLKLAESLIIQHKLDIRSLMPCNVYGPNDHFSDPVRAHVIPALINKFYKAKKKGLKSISIWGSGKPKREFIYSFDLALVIKKILEIPKKKFYKNLKDETFYNVGSGSEISIKYLVKIIAKIVQYKGIIKFDEKYPDGTQTKLIDSSKFNKIIKIDLVNIQKGLELTYSDFISKKIKK